MRGTKTHRSRREVPLTIGGARGARFAVAAARLALRVRRAARRAVRRRELPKAGVGAGSRASGIAKPARLYDLRSTFASNALAAGITVYELARIMGTSVGMIEAHYGALLDTAHESLLERLETSVAAR